VRLAGAVPAESLADFYTQADLFVLASRFEGYGMAFAEAIAAGLPVIGTTAGAIPEAVQGAGVLVPPDDIEALAAALRSVIGDTKERHRLSEGARAAAANLPTWQAAAQTFARVLESVA
jgi:glycosyltransferase involved in cell wall biosynthesis